MSDVSILPAWREHNADFERDAIAFWTRLRGLPESQSPEARAKQLSSVAYAGEKLIGVTTAFIEYCPQVRANLAYYRILLDPNHRGAHTMPPLVMEAFRAIEAWARENPQAAVAGFGSVRQAIVSEEKFRSPYARTTGAALIAFTPSGDQLRVRWFRHFRPD